MVLEKFIEYIQYEKRYSQHTIQAYSKDLNQFSNFLSKQYGISDVTETGHQQIRSWMVYLLEEGLSERSVLRKLSTLKSFFKYLQRNGLVEHNPTLVVIPPKSPKRNPVFVEEDKMQKLFEEVDFGNDFSGLRDRVILEVFYSTGIRLSELIELKTHDVSFSAMTIKVLGKRNKERIIPFTKKTEEAMQIYLELKEKKGLSSDDYLFVSENGKKLNPRQVYRIVNKYLGMVTTLGNRSPHVLRHTFATHMLNNGAELNAIKEFLGHANLAATQVYTHNTVEKLKKIYKNAHPRAE